MSGSPPPVTPRMWRWVCPACSGGGYLADEPCWRCGTVGLTNDVAGWPAAQLRPVPLPPAVMPRVCAGCTFRPDGDTCRPHWCGSGVWRRPDGTPEPGAYLDGMPLGLMVCHRWWTHAAAMALPPSAEPVPEVVDARMVGLAPWSVIRWRRLGDDFPAPASDGAYPMLEVLAFLTEHRLIGPIPPTRTFTLAQMARLARVNSSAASNWKTRNPDFPAPVGRRGKFPLYDRNDALTWILRHCRLDRPRLDRPDDDSGARAAQPLTRTEEST